MSHLEGVVASCEGNGRSVGSRNTYEPMFSVISLKLSICESLSATAKHDLPNDPGK